VSFLAMLVKFHERCPAQPAKTVGYVPPFSRFEILLHGIAQFADQAQV
jgi:hypothetical protein